MNIKSYFYLQILTHTTLVSAVYCFKFSVADPVKKPDPDFSFTNQTPLNVFFSLYNIV